MEFSYSQTENFEMEKLSSDTRYFKKPVEINRGSALLALSVLAESSNANETLDHTPLWSQIWWNP